MDIGSIMGIFVEQPWLALVPAVLFGAAFARWRRPVVLVTAFAWVVYFPYEGAMRLRILCSGDCNIRIDLLLLYPVLALLSIIGVYSLVQSLRKETRA